MYRQIITLLWSDAKYQIESQLISTVDKQICSDNIGTIKF